MLNSPVFVGIDYHNNLITDLTRTGYLPRVWFVLQYLRDPQELVRHQHGLVNRLQYSALAVLNQADFASYRHESQVPLVGLAAVVLPPRPFVPPSSLGLSDRLP